MLKLPKYAGNYPKNIVFRLFKNSSKIHQEHKTSSSIMPVMAKKTQVPGVLQKTKELTIKR
jgi:hypothetical protein